VANQAASRGGLDPRELPAAADLIVVGGGTAGSVVDSRLAEATELGVVLLESGPDLGPFTGGRWPEELLDPHETPTGFDWG
jgi:choline dehydrogenase